MITIDHISVVPFIISVLLAFFTPFFKRDDEFCWVRPDLVVYAIIIPISVLIINAIICTAIVCWRIFGTSRRFARMVQFDLNNLINIIQYYTKLPFRKISSKISIFFSSKFCLSFWNFHCWNFIKRKGWF